MTKQEALEFENQLKAYIAQEATELNIPADSLVDMIDQNVEIYPDKISSMGMFDLGEDSKSIRPGNIRFNLKDFLIAGAALGSSVAYPNTWWGYIALGLTCLVFANDTVGSAIQKITEHEAYIVAYLHTHNMYDHGVAESDFSNQFKIWYRAETGEEITDQRIQKALKKLFNMKSIAIINGEICLMEKVWRNELTS